MKLNKLDNEMMNEKVILVDCDGVLLDWAYAFDCWMESHGHVKQDFNCYDISQAYGIEKAVGKQLVRTFNESAAIGFLPPLRDAVYYLKQLHEKHGYMFHCVTSLSHDPHAQKLREKNLERLFGPQLFEKFVFLDCGADKDDALMQYHGTECYWIEDKEENARVGLNMGLKSILVAHDSNAGVSDIPRFAKWKQIYNYITE